MARRRISFETYGTIFGAVYLGLVTNVLLAVAALPLVALLVTTDPLRSWPLLAAAVPLAAPAVTAACTVFADHAAGGTDVVRTFLAGWRATAARAIQLAAVVSATVVVCLVDIRVLAGGTAGVVFIPALGVLAAVAVAVGVVGLVAVAESPRVRLLQVVRVSGYLALRRWLPTLATLVVAVVQFVVFTSFPGLALGVTASPVLYVVWANSRYVLAPALQPAGAKSPTTTRTTRASRTP